MTDPHDLPVTQPLAAGSPAPTVKLPDQLGTIVDLARTDGPVLLAFHPLAWTPTCREHIVALETRSDSFRQAGVTVFGVSVDPVPTKRAWADMLGLRFVRFLSDFWPHGEVARAFGLFHEGEGVSERATVIVDAGGTVRLSAVHPPAELPDLDAIVDSLRSL